jgi:hypothetical protein
MLGHDYPRPELKVVLCAGLLERLDKPFPRAILAQERQSMDARECQEMRITRQVEVAN